MKSLHSLLACSLFLALCSFISPAAAEESGKGSVNWIDGYIEATGYGTSQSSGNKGKDRINARRAAEVSAQRTLLEVIKGVHITSQSTVEDSILKDDQIKTRVDGIIKGAQLIDEKVEWEGNSPIASVKMRICLNGGNDCKGTSLVNVLNLEKRPDPVYVPQKMLITTPVALETPTQPVVRQYLCDLTKPVSGVVFSLEGRFFERSLLPVIVSQLGTDELVTVYSAKLVKPSVIRTYGAIRYADSVENALKSPQLGANVLVVPIADISKDNMIIISSRDAATIKETLAHGNNYLGDAKVIISVK